MRSWRLRDFFLVPEIAALGPATKMYDLVEYIYCMLVFSQSSSQWIRVNTNKATFIHGCDILLQQRRRPRFFRLLTLGRSNEFQVGSQISGLRPQE